MENRNILQELTGYRLKVEREGKSVIDVPGILCLPGLLAAPRLGIAGMIAAPLLGYNVHLENGSGNSSALVNKLFSSHPDTEARIQRVKQRLAADGIK